jgi:hypothetical protein
MRRPTEQLAQERGGDRRGPAREEVGDEGEVRAVRRRRGERTGSDQTARAGKEKGRGSTALARRPFAGREIDRRPRRLVWRLERSSGGGQEGIDHEFVLDLDAFLRFTWARN